MKDLKNSIYKVINDFMMYYWRCIDNGEEPLSFYGWLWEFAVNIDDDDYCVLEFSADSGRYYRYDGKGDLSCSQIEAFDKDKEFQNGYSSTHKISK